MRLQKLSALAIAGSLVLSLGACSKSNETSTSNSSSTTTAAKETTTTKKSSDSDKSTTTKKSSSGDDSSSDTTEKSSSSDSMPDLNKLGDCMQIGLTYAGLYLNLLGGNSDNVKEVQKSLEDMKSKVPADVAKDLDFLAQNITPDKSMSEISSFMDSDEFKKADKNVQDYLDKTCNGK